MKILLNFYPEFKIKQLSNHTATMFLSNDYDLFIDVNANPGSWTAQRKRGNLRTDLMLRGGRVPKEDVEKADELIKKYQEALVNWVIEREQIEQAQAKEPEIIKVGSKRRGQAPAPPLTSHHREPCIIIPVEEPGPADPPEEVVKEILTTPEEPNLDEIQEAPADQEGEEEVQSSQPEEDKKPKTLEDIREILEKRQAQEAPVLPVWGEKYQALEEKIQEIREKNKEEEKSNLIFRHVFEPVLKFNAGDSVKLEFNNHNINPKIQTMLKDNIIKNIEAAKLQPGENYSQKIGAKSEEIISELREVINLSRAMYPLIPPELRTKISKLEENLEVLRLLQDWQAHQTLRNQEPDEGKQEPAAELNEIRITKNPNGYSWKIIARAADMEEALKAGLKANQRLQNELYPLYEFNINDNSLEPSISKTKKLQPDKNEK